MRPPGAFKIAHRPRSVRTAAKASCAAAVENEVFDARVSPLLAGDERAQRILESLRSEIAAGGSDTQLRIRLVFREPREIFRIELEIPQLGYQRTTLLDRDALEQLLEADEIAEFVRASASGL